MLSVAGVVQAPAVAMELEWDAPMQALCNHVHGSVKLSVDKNYCVTDLAHTGYRRYSVNESARYRPGLLDVVM